MIMEEAVMIRRLKDQVNQRVRGRACGAPLRRFLARRDMFEFDDRVDRLERLDWLVFG